VPSFSAMCETILVLLSGLAAIYSAYPPVDFFPSRETRAGCKIFRLPLKMGEQI